MGQEHVRRGERMISEFPEEDFTCEVCYCRVFKGEESFTVYADDDKSYRLCILCSRAAEINGWRLH